MHETTKRLRFALARRHDETTIRRKKHLVLVVSSFRRLVVEPEGQPRSGRSVLGHRRRGFLNQRSTTPQKMNSGIAMSAAPIPNVALPGPVSIIPIWFRNGSSFTR